MGHNTWTTYYTMTRLYKHYDFSGLSDRHAVGRRVSMSSYPGVVSSIDDWYTIGAPTHLHVSVSSADLGWCAAWHVGTRIGVQRIG